MEISVIKTKKQYQQYLNRMQEIFDAKKGSPESDELDLLALVIEKYEEEKFHIPEPDPIEAIRFIMEQNGLSNKDLGKVLNSTSHTSEILNKKRKLNLKQIRILEKEFNIPAEILIRDYELA